MKLGKFVLTPPIGAISAVLLSAVLSSSAFGKTVYLKADATGEGTGDSWENACTDIATAVGKLETGSDDRQIIYAAQGVYVVNATITAVKNFELYGGFKGDETGTEEAMLAARDWDLDVVRALESVRDDHLAARGERGEAVLVGGLDVVERVLPATDVERVRVREERTPTGVLDEVRERLHPVRTQHGETPRLTEVHLDGRILPVEVQLPQPGGLQETCELLLQVLAVVAAEIREIDR